MDESVDIVLSNSFSNTLRAFNMDVLEIKIPVAHVQADVLRARIDRQTYLVG